MSRPYATYWAGRRHEPQTSHARFFPYRYDHRFAPLWLPYRPWPGAQGVALTDERLVARYGPFRVDVPLSQIDEAHITGPYRWWTAVGARLSMVDDGLTFGTNASAGVCIHFDPPIRRVIGWRDHSALTVTVADPDGLLEVLADAIADHRKHSPDADD